MCWKNFGYSSRSTHSTFTIFWIFNAAGEALLRACCWQLDDDAQIPCKVASLQLRLAGGLSMPVACHMSLVAGSDCGADSDCDSDAMFTLSTCVVCPLPYSVLRHSTAAGAETEKERGVAGGQLLHSMCAAGSGIISNCVYTFAMQQQHRLLLLLQLLVPLERLDVCNLPAQHILHKHRSSSLSSLLSCFLFIKNSFFCVLFTLTFHLCLLMQLQIVWHTRTVKVLSGFARFDK